MTTEIRASDQRGGARTVMVGIQLDARGKEVLDWAISKVAQHGDRILAVHVCRDSDLRSTTTLSLIQVLEDYLAPYEGICDMKQIALVGRVSRGNSIRKVLVKEAKLCNAMAVVVGVIKHCSLGGVASLAKYCAKKLPSTTSLVAVQNGKIIFERKADAPNPDQLKPTLGSVLHPSVAVDAQKFFPNSTGRRPTDSGSSTATVATELPESKLGWPLLRRASSGIPEVKRGSEAERKMPVVKWAMSLPNRSLLSSKIHSDLVLNLNAILINSSSKWFHYDELQTATNNFSSENVIGKGGSSKVYKGRIPGGKKVAIKLLKLSETSSKDFVLEVDIITKVQHKCIVPLIGICVDDNTLISVYSYFSKGSLEENLHGNKAKPSSLSWDQRYKVAVGVAEALTYLHSGCSRPVIHRDLKSSNILLNDDFEPQLSDFGLAIWAPTASACMIHNDVVGTFGYLAPEYFMYGKVSDKMDVYAFGVVLLELLTGRKSISEESPKGQESLVMWAKPMLGREDFVDALDPNLDASYNEVEVRRMILAASLCITRRAHLRPQMNQILRLLRGEEDIEPWMIGRDDSNMVPSDCQDEELCAALSMESHLGLALLDVEDDESVISFEQSCLVSLEEYLRGRWSRSSSFD